MAQGKLGLVSYLKPAEVGGSRVGPALAESAEELLLGMGRCDPAGKLGSRGVGVA